MKSFLEFVPCFGYSIQDTVSTTTTTPSVREDSRSSPSRQRRRLNRSNSVSSSAAQWQPSLCAISEDKVVAIVVAKKAEEPAKLRKKVAQKTSSRAEIRVRTSYGDNFARSSVPLAIPSFSPTAFLF